MDGWPEGWACFGAGGPNERFVSAGDRYVLYGEREGCRRAAWAISGGAVAVDREALAKALHDVFNKAVRGCSVWGDRSADTRQGYLAEADEAIRLLSFEPRVDRVGVLTTIEELERRNAALTDMAHAARRRAMEAANWAEELGVRHTRDLAAALGHTDGAQFSELVAIAGQRSEMLAERAQRIEELRLRNDILTATANAAVARAEEAQLQAQRDEQDSETIALRAEVQRLRRALDRTAQGAAYLTDALSELTGGDHA